MTTLTLDIDTPRVFKPLLTKSRYKGAHGGRGSGKSHFYAEALIEKCLVKKTSGVCIREVQKSLDQSVKKLLEIKIEDLGVGSFFKVQDVKILTPNGGNIIFQGMQNHTADSIKSLEDYDVAWVEEAQSISQRSLDLLRPTIRKDDSELWFSWNPNSEEDPVDVLLRGEDLPPNSVVVEANYSDNPFFPDVLKEEMLFDLKRDHGKYLHVWMGEYQQQHEAMVFKNWHVEEFEAPADAIFRFGADWGFAVDPTVLVRCYIVGKKLYVDYEAHKVGCDIDFTPDLFATISESEKWPITADSARPETISYVKKHGFPHIAQAVKGPGSIEDGVEFLKSYDIVVHPRCVKTIQELKSYRYKTDPLTEKVLPIFEDKHNHVIDSLRYACEGARRVSKPSKKFVRPRKKSRWG